MRSQARRAFGVPFRITSWSCSQIKLGQDSADRRADREQNCPCRHAGNVEPRLGFDFRLFFARLEMLLDPTQARLDYTSGSVVLSGIIFMEQSRPSLFVVFNRIVVQ